MHTIQIAKEPVAKTSVADTTSRKRLYFGDNYENNLDLLKEALQRMAKGKNVNTPLFCKITIQTVCKEAKLDYQNIYRNRFWYYEVFDAYRTKEMERKKALLRKALNDFSNNMHLYFPKKGFRLSMNELMRIAGLSKDQYKALTIPMDDLVQEMKQVRTQFRKKKLKAKNLAPNHVMFINSAA